MAYIAPPLARRAANNQAFQDRLDEYLLLKLTKPNEYNPHHAYFDDSDEETYDDDPEFSSDEYFFLQLRRQGNESCQETSARLRAPYSSPLSPTNLEYGHITEPEPELHPMIVNPEVDPSPEGNHDLSPRPETLNDEYPDVDPTVTPIMLGFEEPRRPRACNILEFLMLIVHYVYFITSLVSDLCSDSLRRWMSSKASLRLRDSFRGGTYLMVSH